MAGPEAHGSWHTVSSIFAIFAILQCMEWPTPDYYNSLDFMNETGIFLPDASSHKEHYVKTSASDVHGQHKIWMPQQPTN